MSNQIAINFIKEKEGCRLAAYLDSAGIRSVGFGHTGPEVKAGLVWSQQQADEALASDVAKAAAAVDDLAQTALTENQRAALTSFVFNLGPAALQSSTLLTILRQRNFLDAAKQFIRWDRADNQENKGLLIRRMLEAVLFLEGS